MKKQFVFLLVFLFLTYTTVGRKLNHGEECTIQCSKTYIKNFNSSQCKEYYKDGNTLSKCSWNRQIDICKHKCLSGPKRCHRICSTKECYGKQVQVCQKKCTSGEQCVSECIYRKYKNCYFDRLPGYLIDRCKSVFQNDKNKSCLKRCLEVKRVPDTNGTSGPNPKVTYKWVPKNEKKNKKKNWKVKFRRTKYGHIKQVVKKPCYGTIHVSTVNFWEGQKISLPGRCVEIVFARFGYGKKWFEVIEQLQHWVDSQKELKNVKIDMNGTFGDPFRGRKKLLQVKYTYRT
eukprot:gene8736-684_t